MPTGIRDRAYRRLGKWGLHTCASPSWCDSYTQVCVRRDELEAACAAYRAALETYVVAGEIWGQTHQCTARVGAVMGLPERLAGKFASSSEEDRCIQAAVREALDEAATTVEGCDRDAKRHEIADKIRALK